MTKRSLAIGFLRFAGRFYKWAFKSIFQLTKKSDEHIKAIQQKQAAERARLQQGDSYAS